jgi:hypothetical protein
MRLDSWFQAQIVCPPIICGVQLLPFSIGHEYILRRLDNPYLVGGPRTRESLLECIQICSRNMAKNRTWFAEIGTRWGTIKLAWWAFRLRKLNLTIAGESFCQYMMDYVECPDHWDPASDVSGGGKGSCAPWEYHLHRIMCEVYHYTADEAWDVPLARARCYFDAWAESNGDKSLVSEHEQELSILAGA